jgi:hypothetical protein
LVVDDSTIRIRGALRTRRMTWDDVAAFSLGRWRFLGCVLLVHRFEGAPVPVMAVEGITGDPTRRTSERAQAITDELNERLLRVTGRPRGRSATRLGRQRAHIPRDTDRPSMMTPTWLMIAALALDLAGDACRTLVHRRCRRGAERCGREQVDREAVRRQARVGRCWGFSSILGAAW